MNKSIGFGCALFVAGVTFAQTATTTTTVAPAQTPAAATVASATAPAAPQQPTQQELKVIPGSVLFVWKGKDMSEPEIASLVDKGKFFNDTAADFDHVAKSVSERTFKWSGILNIDQPGLYTFNAVVNQHWEGTTEFRINGVSVFKTVNESTVAKNVQIPGPVNVDVIMVFNGRIRNNLQSLSLRYKKAGTLKYKYITPEDLFHGAE